MHAICWLMDKQTYRLTDWCQIKIQSNNRQTDRPTQTDIQTDRHTDRQTDIQTDRQTDRQTDSYVCSTFFTVQLHITCSKLPQMTNVPCVCVCWFPMTHPNRHVIVLMFGLSKQHNEMLSSHCQPTGCMLCMQTYSAHANYVRMRMLEWATSMNDMALCGHKTFVHLQGVWMVCYIDGKLFVPTEGLQGKK